MTSMSDVVDAEIVADEDVDRFACGGNFLDTDYSNNVCAFVVAFAKAEQFENENLSCRNVAVDALGIGSSFVERLVEIDCLRVKVLVGLVHYNDMGDHLESKVGIQASWVLMALVNRHTAIIHKN